MDLQPLQTNKYSGKTKAYSLKTYHSLVNWITSGLTLREWYLHAQTYGTTSFVTNRLIFSCILGLLVPLVLIGSINGRLEDNLIYLHNLGRVGIIPNRQIGTTNLPPIFAAIAECESGGSQYDSYGQVVRGRVNHHDVGLYQINEVIHQNAIAQTGVDIYNEEGNAQFARYLYEAEGLYPWRSSQYCWSRYLN
ncbi:MAG: hypothetical protein AAB738_00790 [Patescibacteria group bacterium]